MIIKEYMLARDYISYSLKKDTKVDISHLKSFFNLDSDMIVGLLEVLIKKNVLRRDDNGYIIN